MEFELSGTSIKSEQELVALAKRINTEIEFSNITGNLAEKEELLDISYLIRRYWEIIGKEDAKIFREKHECKFCLYYEKQRQCFEKQLCPLDKGANPRNFSKKKCLRDKEENCPYGNEVGTCFGFCLKEILSEQNGRKQKNVQNEEKEEHG